MGSSNNLIVKNLKKKRRAVFAAKNFKKGDFLHQISGRVISRDAMLASSRYLSDHMGTLGKNKYIIMGYPERYINHSCNPNIYEINLKIYAMKNIRKCEEITYDYSICSIDDWKMKCKCKHKNCRKIVKGNFFELPKRLQIKYLPYLDDWFKKEFKNEIENL